MAATPEKKVKAKVVAQLKELGAYYFYPVTGGFGASGVPDIICCYEGWFFAFECKANGNKPTQLQQLNIDKINGSGGVALVIDEHNVDTVKAILQTSKGK